MPTPDEHYSEFERIGATKVRENLALGLITGRRAEVAKFWLEQLSLSEFERKASNKQTLQTVAAVAAVIAAIAATIGVIASIIQLFAPHP